MFHIGTAGYPAGSKRPLDALRVIRSSGLNALEVQFVRQARMGEDKARELGERARELGILLSAHAPYYINLNSKKPDVVESSVERIVKTVRIAHWLGARVVVVHAAMYHDDPPEKVTEAVIKHVDRCLSAMSDERLSPLIGLEVMGKKAAWGRIPEIGEVVSALDRVVPVVDFAHIHAVGEGALRSIEDVRKALRQVREYHRGRLHCHYSSVEYGERGERKHLPLNEEEPSFKLIAKALLEWEGDVTLISETPSSLTDAVAMKRILGQITENSIHQ